MPQHLRPDHLDYALRLHAVLTATGDFGASGVVWSPYSVAAAMGLVAAGAGGRTRAELSALLGDDISGHLAALDLAVSGDDGIATSTGLWVRGDLPLDPEFEAEVRTRPACSVQAADFAGDPEGVRALINAAVSETTRGLIAELLEPGSVQASAQALLVNALWMRLRWDVPFAAEKTVDRPFHAPDGTRDAATMHRKTQLPYAEADGWRMVSLAGQNDLVMDVLLPDGDGGQAPLTPDVVDALQRNLSSRATVDLALPRFELRRGIELVPPLERAGVRELFTDAADLSGVSPRPLLVDRVIHQAVLKVDEKGAEGAAATAVVMRPASFQRPEHVTFTVDRPFTVVVRRRSAILFLGLITDPDDPGPAG